MIDLNLPLVGDTRQLWERWFGAHRLFWQRLLIILAVLGISAFAAYKLPGILQFGILVVPIGVAALLILLRWPPLGLLALIIGSMIMPIHIPPLGLTAAMVLGLTGLWIFRMITQERQIKIVRSPTILPLIMLLVVAILAFVVGQIPWFPITSAPIDAQIGGLGIFVVVIAAYLLVAHQVTSLAWLKWMTYLFLGLGSIYMIGRVIRPLSSYLVPFFNAGAVGSLFWTWIVALSVALGLFHRRLPLWARGALLGLTLLTLYVGFVQANGWTSGWLPAFVALGVVILVGEPRLIIPVGLGGALLLLVFSQPIIDSVVYGENEYSTVTRVEAWRIVLEIVKVNPILGLGPANYSWYTPLFPILGWYVQLNSHNNYIDIIAQTGLLGLFFFLWFMWEMARLGWRMRTRAPDGGFARAYVYGAIGGLAGTAAAAMLGDWVIPYVYNIGINGLRAGIMGWLFLGGLLALRQMADRQEVGAE